ncbi:hypothetical protein KK196_12095 [Pseudomonas aeruginosa]|uniref:hypothetical protein n=1 Tax=Pseudomonas aeruginosa TaxID=287 RepID=UPI000A63B787|nr:hypothetical protein [Pseudomonas aeruginosa]MDU0550457.1 hypothetical protein [Pseudomonas aeruginosa]WCW33296.1 hypothetical protein KK218_11620 [Pseudomonas aeruginosa]WCW45444.1 hypothetical protein KK196_12095 [Pseudomonas aeruginosa]WCW51138.1 hypothetical protein KK184_11620 [Pseudomonas aeruginosa]WCW62458.1 hypothetical protein KK202_11620 [Pseudomonas aeruginosa]
MNQKHWHPTDAEQAIVQQLETFQGKAARIWWGNEKEAVITLVRALDTSADIHMQGIGSNRFISLGTAAALRPFLSRLENQPSSLKWKPMRPKAAQFAFSYLESCGQLTHLSRLAALERQGLATTSFLNSEHIVIKVPNSAPEFALQYAIRSRKKRTLASNSIGSLDKHRWQQLHERMSSYVDSPDGWFIHYESDKEITSAYLEKAKLYGKGFLEAEAFPDDVSIGGRSFGEWKHACDHALSRILCHIDFVGLLQRKNPGISASDVLTRYDKRNAIDQTWLTAGLSANQIAPTMEALTLKSGNLSDWEKAHETPCSFYISLDKEHVLLPCFGALANPYFALFRHLRHSYKSDWDRSVDRREAIFRNDLAKAFPEPNFLVPSHGFRLRRINGSQITDVDAIILDKRHGTMVLVQLKWHDVFGFSLPERESRRRNIVKANEWTQRVLSWIDGRTSAELVKALGLDATASDTPPILYVVARYAARFSGELDQDPRASWLGWPEILNVLDEHPTGDVLSLIPQLVLDQQTRFAEQEDQRFEFRFPNLAVDLHITKAP